MEKSALADVFGQDEELSDIFYTSQKKGFFRVKLNRNGLTLQRECPSGIKEQAINMCDIIGGRCMRMHRKSRPLGCVCSSSTRSVASADHKSGGMGVIAGDVCAYLYIFAYVLQKKNLRSTLRRERTVVTLRFHSFDKFEENMREAERWYKTLRQLKHCTLDGAINMRSKRLLVLLNPKSGKGKARELFHQQVTQVLNEAEQSYDLHVTRHANYAREFVRVRNLTSWSGIVAIGGDGLLNEILNGFLQRADWQEIIQHMPLGIVPCGSGNGLARSIAHVCNEPYDPKPIVHAALALVSGKTAPMDVVRIELKNQVMYSFLSVGWGLISDIDIESERLRSLGYQRFTLWTLHRLISLRTYHGKVSYLLKNDADASIELTAKACAESKLKHSTSCNTYLNSIDHENGKFQSMESIGITDNEFDDVISLEMSANPSLRTRCDSWFSTGSRKSTYYSVSESIYHSIADNSEFDPNVTTETSAASDALCGPSGKASLDDPLPSNWIVEDGEFIMVHAAYQTHLGTDCFFAPSANLNDGTIYLFIIRGGISRSQLFNFMVNLSSGTHLPTKDSEFIKVVPVIAFRIEPNESHGIITIDGERVEFGSLHAEMLPATVNVMIPK